MFQLNTFLFWLFSKEKILLFTKHMRIQSRSYNKNKNKRSFSINPFAPHSSRIRNIFFSRFFFQVWICSFGIWALLFSTYFFLFFISFRFSFPLFSFYFLPSFLKSHKVWWSCKIWPIFSSSEGYEINQIDFSIKSTMWNLRFFLFLYPYPIGTAFESIENLFFCI